MASSRALASFKRILIASAKAQTVVTPVQTLSGIRHRCPAVLKDPKCQPISWVAVFGSFSRNQQKRTSRIDMMIGFHPDISKLTMDWKFASNRFAARALKLFGRKVDVLEVRPPDPEMQDIESYELLEALLSSIIVYGPNNWHDCARTRARSMVDEGYRRLWNAYHIMKQMDKALEMTTKNVSNSLKFTKRRNFFSATSTAPRF